jgi:hypothetical protein
MDLTEGSETSAKLNQTPGKYPKENIQTVMGLLYVTFIHPHRYSAFKKAPAYEPNEAICYEKLYSLITWNVCARRKGHV